MPACNVQKKPQSYQSLSGGGSRAWVVPFVYCLGQDHLTSNKLFCCCHKAFGLTEVGSRRLIHCAASGHACVSKNHENGTAHHGSWRQVIQDSIILNFRPLQGSGIARVARVIMNCPQTQTSPAKSPSLSPPDANMGARSGSISRWQVQGGAALLVGIRHLAGYETLSLAWH
jgi:hypothetical protein